MNCCLYQLRFNTAVHFGGSGSALSLYSSEAHFRADTLFSALCHTALQISGPDGIEKLIGLVRQGALLLSDAMPWRGETFYIPKPCYSPGKAPELPPEKRKAIKKLSWIPGDRLAEYCAALNTGNLFDCQQPVFGRMDEQTKATIPEKGDTLPYPFGTYRFYENCGLYFFAALENSRDVPWLTSLVEALGIGGIGGKVTAGYGKFSVVMHPAGAFRPLADGETAPGYLLLTTSLPRSEELDDALDGASFQLCRRAGFIAANSKSPRKKQTQYYLSAGAVLRKRFGGELYHIGDAPEHPVYRYSKPLFLGVPL